MEAAEPGAFIGRTSNEPKAVDGIFKVMTVDGVETPITEGNYSGEVVIHELDGAKRTYYETVQNIYQSALYIEENTIVQEKSATSALSGGSYSAGFLNDVSSF